MPLSYCFLKSAQGFTSFSKKAWTAFFCDVQSYTNSAFVSGSITATKTSNTILLLFGKKSMALRRPFFDFLAGRWGFCNQNNFLMKIRYLSLTSTMTMTRKYALRGLLPKSSIKDHPLKNLCVAGFLIMKELTRKLEFLGSVKPWKVFFYKQLF